MKAKVQIGDILVVSLPFNDPSGHEDIKRVESVIGSLNKLQIKLIQKSLKEMLNLN